MAKQVRSNNEEILYAEWLQEKIAGGKLQSIHNQHRISGTENKKSTGPV